MAEKILGGIKMKKKLLAAITIGIITMLLFIITAHAANTEMALSAEGSVLGSNNILGIIILCLAIGVGIILTRLERGYKKRHIH